jgi:hypothetical protein
MVAVGEIQVGGQNKALKNATKVGVPKIYMVGKQRLVNTNLPLHDNLYMTTVSIISISL